MRRRLIPPQQAFLGMGTAGSPYRIATAGQLADLATKVNAGATDTLRGGLYKDKHYLQVAHLDLSAYANWVPIGSGLDKVFNGVYDGNGFSLFNLTITNLANWGEAVSLFSNIDGILKNLCIASGTITGRIASAFANSGKGEIIRCCNSANIVGATGAFTSARIIGGISAQKIKVTDCVNYGNVTQNGTTSSGVKLVAGIAGAPDAGQVTRCFNVGVVSGVEGVIQPLNANANSPIDSYYDADTSGATQANATGLTTAQCTGTAAQTNMPNLDWVNVWRTNEGAYPTLRVFDK